MINKLFISLLIFVSLSACQSDLSKADKDYIDSIKKFRYEKDKYMKNDPFSPFNAKGKIHFNNLRYYEINLDLKFRSMLKVCSRIDTIIIFGTKGEPRKTEKLGFVTFNYANHNYKLNIYKSNYNGNDFYSIWFTDKTTNKESYGVGRYLDFELNADPNFVYNIDFNLAYNPYCAYSLGYSCAIPSKEDYIDLEINAGEKIFHE